MTDTAMLREDAAAAAIDAACKNLHLPTVRADAGPTADAAERDRLTHPAYLAELLSAETDARTLRRRQRRINEAKFPRVKTLEAFDPAATPNIPGGLLTTLATCAWIDRGEPLALLGDSGTGKPHLLTAAGHAAVEAGHRVRYLSAAELVETLYRGQADNSVRRVIDQLLRNDVVLVDEVGFAPWTPPAPNCCSASPPPPTNAARSGSAHTGRSTTGAFLPEHTAAASLLDRLLHHAVVIVTDGDSYRMRTRGGGPTP